VKWTLFTLLMLIAPSLLFLVMAIMFVPAIFFAAGIVYMIPKALVPSQTMETLTFIGFFGAHLLVYAGFYYFISVIGAKLLFLVRNPTTRNTAFAVVCLGVMLMALLPVYGGGGHGPIRWNTLLDVFHELNRDYGPYTVLVVYGSYIICVAALLAYRKHRRNKPASARPHRTN
jgi:glucan phosphoethanolaminetransferase (alkaline phosphatase superfamily)